MARIRRARFLLALMLAVTPISAVACGDDDEGDVNIENPVDEDAETDEDEDDTDVEVDVEEDDEDAGGESTLDEDADY